MGEPTPFVRRARQVLAMQYTLDTCDALHEWLGFEHRHDDCHMGVIDGIGAQCLTADWGDWVVDDPACDEFIVIDPDAFIREYDEIRPDVSRPNQEQRWPHPLL